MRTILSAVFVSALALAAPSGAFAAGGYIQASSEEDQIAKDTKPQKVTMNSTDAAKGLKNDKGTIILNESGTYFTIVGVQVGSRGGTGLVRLFSRPTARTPTTATANSWSPPPISPPS
jgi:hypothetical protein